MSIKMLDKYYSDN